MMLALWGLVSKVRPADAHDAGSLGFGVQTLALWGSVSKLRPADVHDAGSLGFGVQTTPS